MFCKRDQEESESFDEYYMALGDLIRRCAYEQMENPTEQLLRDRIVIVVRDEQLRKQLLEKKSLSLS